MTRQDSQSWWTWVVLAACIAGLLVGVVLGERLEPDRVFDVHQSTDGDPVVLPADEVDG